MNGPWEKRLSSLRGHFCNTQPYRMYIVYIKEIC